MFVALVPPTEAIEHLDEFLAPRRPAGELRWARTDQLHVTLAFLDSVAEHRLDELVERLGRAAARRTSFETRIAGGGAFPNVGRARVLWAGLELDEHGRTELDRLAVGARAAASRTGIEVEGRRFRPHLTVARLARPAELTSWVRLLDAYSGPSWRAAEVALIWSHLGEGPRRTPRYELVDTFPLASQRGLSADGGLV
jgi:2'-5' RNA ligase